MSKYAYEVLNDRYSKEFVLGDAEEVPANTYFSGTTRLDCRTQIPKSSNDWSPMLAEVENPPEVSLDNLKIQKTFDLYTAFKDRCYGVFWSNASGGYYGYDADKDSNVDFLSAKDRARDARDAWTMLPEETREVEPTILYKVHFENGSKDFIPHTYAMFAQVMSEVANKQIPYYLSFKERASQITAATNVAELDAISITFL